MAEPRYKVVNGEYIELTAEELQEIADRNAAADLDFSMVRHDLGSHTAEEWAAYRQELRDLPSKHSKVSEVVWPDDPPTAAAKAAE